MILYENIDFAVTMRASDYVFTAVENFMHEWSLQAQRHILGVGLVNHPKYKNVIVEATSLDEVKIWLDIHIPGAKILCATSYAEYVNYAKMSTIPSCGSTRRKTY